MSTCYKCFPSSIFIRLHGQVGYNAIVIYNDFIGPNCMTIFTRVAATLTHIGHSCGLKRSINYNITTIATTVCCYTVVSAKEKCSIKHKKKNQLALLKTFIMVFFMHTKQTHSHRMDEQLVFKKRSMFNYLIKNSAWTMFEMDF